MYVIISFASLVLSEALGEEEHALVRFRFICAAAMHSKLLSLWHSYQHVFNDNFEKLGSKKEIRSE